MENFIQYWSVLLATIATFAVAALAIYKFTNQPTEQQLLKVKEWLLFAVTEAEKDLGSGVGQLKLRYVYDMFINKFSFLVKVVSFETFSSLVDEVLVDFRHMMESNPSLKQYVYSEGELDEGENG